MQDAPLSAADGAVAASEVVAHTQSLEVSMSDEMSSSERHSILSNLTRRRRLVGVCAAFAAAPLLASASFAAGDRTTSPFTKISPRIKMNTVTTRDGTVIFYKDWGRGTPIVFHHGWALSADDWDAQMMFFVEKGYRVIAHDRRGHGRSSQTDHGHDMNTYADDVAALTTALNLKGAIHVGHSTGVGEVVRYIARHGKARVAKAVLISAVPPIMLKTEKNPGVYPWKCSMDSAHRSPPTVHSFTATFQLPSTA